jgi:hypothetical protein
MFSQENKEQERGLKGKSKAQDSVLPHSNERSQLEGSSEQKLPNATLDFMSGLKIKTIANGNSLSSSTEQDDSPDKLEVPLIANDIPDALFTRNRNVQQKSTLNLPTLEEAANAGNSFIAGMDEGAATSTRLASFFQKFGAAIWGGSPDMIQLLGPHITQMMACLGTVGLGYPLVAFLYFLQDYLELKLEYKHSDEAKFKELLDWLVDQQVVKKKDIDKDKRKVDILNKIYQYRDLNYHYNVPEEKTGSIGIGRLFRGQALETVESSGSLNPDVDQKSTNSEGTTDFLEGATEPSSTTPINDKGKEKIIEDEVGSGEKKEISEPRKILKEKSPNKLIDYRLSEVPLGGLWRFLRRIENHSFIRCVWLPAWHTLFKGMLYYWIAWWGVEIAESGVKGEQPMLANGEEGVVSGLLGDTHLLGPALVIIFFPLLLAAGTFLYLWYEKYKDKPKPSEEKGKEEELQEIASAEEKRHVDRLTYKALIEICTIAMLTKAVKSSKEGNGVIIEQIKLEEEEIDEILKSLTNQHQFSQNTSEISKTEQSLIPPADGQNSEETSSEESNETITTPLLKKVPAKENLPSKKYLTWEAFRGFMQGYSHGNLISWFVSTVVCVILALAIGTPILAFLGTPAGAITLLGLWVAVGVIAGFIYAVKATAEAVEKKRQDDILSEELIQWQKKKSNDKEIREDTAKENNLYANTARDIAKQQLELGPNPSARVKRKMQRSLEKNSLAQEPHVVPERTFLEELKKLPKNFLKHPGLTILHGLRIFRVFVNVVGNGTYTARSLFIQYAPLAIAMSGILALSGVATFTMGVAPVIVLATVFGFGAVWAGLMVLQHLHERHQQKNDCRSKTAIPIYEMKKDTHIYMQKLLSEKTEPVEIELEEPGKKGFKKLNCEELVVRQKALKQREILHQEELKKQKPSQSFLGFFDFFKSSVNKEEMRKDRFPSSEDISSMKTSSSNNTTSDPDTLAH